MSSKSAAAVKANATPTYVGVDDGHYSIKVVTETGTMHTIPSRAKAGRHLIAVQGSDNDGNLYEVEEGTVYTVNEYLTQPDDTRFKGYPTSPMLRTLVHHGLLGAGLGGQDVVIATGLPVSYYYLADGNQDRALIDGKMANLAKSVKCGGRQVARIVKNVVTTEAIAAYFDMLIGMDGRPAPDADELERSMVGVIDVGGKTTDCAVVHPGGEQVDVARSGSSDVGVLQLNDSVEAMLRTKFELDNVPVTMVEDAVRNGTVKICGVGETVANEVRQAKERLAEQIMSTVRAKIGSGKDLQFVLFVGGGAIVMRDQLAKHFPHARFPDRPEFANARGMLKIVKYVLAA